MVVPVAMERKDIKRPLSIPLPLFAALYDALNVIDISRKVVKRGLSNLNI